MSLRILFFGDVVGAPGRRFLRDNLARIRFEKGVDLVIVNGENASGGVGLTPKTAEELFSYGVDIITSGNHIWKYREMKDYLSTSDSVLRPANYPEGAPGKGYTIKQVNGFRVAVVNLQGRVFMEPVVDCPFRKADRVLDEISSLGGADVIVVDFHAEATSEKKGLAYYLDGRVTAFLGTHTHVQTADAQILPGGTAYITDAGMVGPFDSVIGMRKEDIISRFLSGLPTRFEVASGKVVAEGVILDIIIGSRVSIERLRMYHE